MIAVIQIAAAVLAAVLVMILHELPKAIVYNITSRKKVPLSDIFHLLRYIDPIGVIFCIATGAGFSKPYPFKIESKRQPMVIGMAGLASMLLVFSGMMLIYTRRYHGFHMYEILFDPAKDFQFAYWFISLTILYSLCMFFMNLIPIATFDMGLILASVSMNNYIAIIRQDTVMKLLLYVVLVLQMLPILTIHIVRLI